MSRQDVINSIDEYLAEHVVAISQLHTNAALPHVDITINGSVTRIFRFQTNRLLRALVVLEHIGRALDLGTLVTQRGIRYYYLHRFGKKEEHSFAKALKMTVNCLNVPSNLLYLTEPNTLAFGLLKLQSSTGIIWDLASNSEGTQLGREILKPAAFKVIGELGRIKRIIHVEKRTIFRQMVQMRWDKTMEAVIVCSQGWPRVTDKAWIHTLRGVLQIPEDMCSSVCDYGPHGFAITHSFAFVKNPIHCENVFKTRLKIVVTPNLMSNFPEAMAAKNTEFKEADINMFKFLVKDENMFLSTNREVRGNQLKKMLEKRFKCDLDLLDIQKLLKALELAIKRDLII